MERTYIMIKPDGVQRGLIGKIISRFEDRGFRLAGLKMLQAQDEVLEEHYAELKVGKAVCCLKTVSDIMAVYLTQDRPFFPGLMEYIKSGPVVAMAWEGRGAVGVARSMLGATNPSGAAPGTIRGDLALIPGRNVAHGSDSAENGEREIGLWFSEEELIDWAPATQSWLYDD